MQRTFKAILIGLAWAGGAFAAAAQEKVVNVYNWSDYIDETILEEFEQETGIKVVYDTYDSNDILETKLLAGRTGYDVVVPTSSFLARQIQAGVLQKLDKSKLPNLKHMSPEIMERMTRYDPGNQYGVVYMWGTSGIGYNVEKVKERMADAPVSSLRMIFDPAVAEKFADCGIYVLDAPDELIPAALKYIGENPDSKDPKVLEKAEPVLMKVRPYIRKFHSSQYIEDLANGDICVAFGWSGDVVQAQTRAAEAGNGVEVAYSIPKEGALMWFDNFAVPKEAPHPDNAHAFINYMMKPEVIAKATNYVFYPNANQDAEPLVNDEVKEDPNIYPPPEVRRTLYTITPFDQQSQRVINRIWTRVKGG